MATPHREAAASSGAEQLVGRRIGRFQIQRLLGAGGMGEVYLAYDTVLRREVAVKRLSPKLRADADARQQILKEAQRASALSSPNIAGVYDVVEDQEEVLLVMEYVEGESLRRRMRATPMMAMDAFLPVAIQCADALAAAHARGIIHRDIKPENVMLTGDGRVKVLDFGLARRVPVLDEGADTASLESIGSGYAGTPGYMAPEVLREEPSDTRADLFSLGVVFYEMLTGQHPFRQSKPVATLDHVLHREPRPLAEALPGSPAELERIVFKTLAKDPSARYATAADLAVDLRALQHGSRPPAVSHRLRDLARLVALVFLFLVLATVFPSVHQHWREWLGRPELPETRNLAVLPFTGSDNATRAYSEGLAETLGAKLAQLTDRYPLQVIPTSEVRAQKVSSVDQARIGLGATLVLEGSVRQAGDIVRVTYDLVDARAKRTLRADTITLGSSDPFTLEDRVVDSVLRSLEVELTSKDRRALAAHGTTQPAAYDFYLQGRGYLQDYEQPENVDSAITVFGRALERDPEYALAYAGLGEAYWHKYQITHDVSWLNRAAEECGRAKVSPAGHICLGRVLDATGQYEKAAAEFEQAVRLDPTSDDAYRNLATVYEHLGRVADAEKTYREAIRLRPNYWAGYNWLGTFLFRRGRVDEAIVMFARVTMLAPDSFRGYNNLGAAYLLMGRYGDAIPELQRSVAIRPNPDAYSNLGTALFYRRRYQDAAHAFRQAIQMDGNNYQLWGNLGDALYWGAKAPVGSAKGEAAEAYSKASALARARLGVNARDATACSYLGLYQAMLGQAGEARQARDRSVALARAEPEVLFNAALITDQSGDSAGAVSWIVKALAAGYSVDLVRNSPNLDNLKSSAAYQQALQGKH